MYKGNKWCVYIKAKDGTKQWMVCIAIILPHKEQCKYYYVDCLTDFNLVIECLVGFIQGGCCLLESYNNISEFLQQIFTL